MLDVIIKNTDECCKLLGSQTSKTLLDFIEISPKSNNIFHAIIGRLGQVQMSGDPRGILCGAQGPTYPPQVLGEATDDDEGRMVLRRTLTRIYIFYSYLSVKLTLFKFYSGNKC